MRLLPDNTLPPLAKVAAFTNFLILAMLATVPCLLAACSRPCESPVRYRLGNIDKRFRLSAPELLGVLREAEAVWENKDKHNLFEYADDGEVVISLVYDDRQLTAQENAKRKYTIETSGSLADDAKAKLDDAQARYQAAANSFDVAVAAHQTRLAVQDANIAKWNTHRKGGDSAEYDALQNENVAIDAEAAALEKKRGAVNSLAARANYLSDRYNELAIEVNTNVAAVNTTAGHEFKQGHFISDANGKRIDVYEFSDRSDLVHVLAHEMGHALGLEHNNNAASIMYGLNSSQTQRPSAEDLAALKERCSG